MRSSKFIRALRSLDADGLAALDRHVDRKIRPSTRLAALFRFVRPHHPDYPSAHLRKEAVFRHLYPGEAYDDMKMRNLLRRGYAVVRDVVRDTTDAAPAASDDVRMLAHALRHGDERLYRTTRRAVRDRMESSPRRDEDHFLQLHRIEVLEREHIARVAQTRGRYREAEAHGAMSALDVFFILSKLKQACARLNFQQVFERDGDEVFEQAVLRAIDDHPDVLDHPAVAIYHAIYRTLTDPDDEAHFHQLKDAIGTHHAIFRPDEARDVFIFVQNYCIRRINAGRSDFLSTLLDVYELGLSTGLIYRDDELSPWDFKNIVTLGLRLGRHDWTRTFIDAQAPRLPDDERSNALTYNTANLHFHTGEHTACIQALLTVEYNDVFYQLGAKTLLLKSYYELDAFDPLTALSESFRTLLRRKKDISDQSKHLYLNFLKILGRLISSHLDRSRLKAIDSAIDETSPLADRAWLKAKVAELL